MNEKLFAHLEWRTSPLSMAEFLERMRQYVRRLAEVSDVFGVLRITRAPKSHPPIRPEDDDFIDRLIPFAYDREFPHDGLDDRSKPTRHTTAPYGLMISLSTPGPDRNCIWFWLDDGPTGVDSVAATHMYFPASGDLAGMDLAEALFRASVAFWAPAWGWLTASSVGEAGQGIRVGWRTYLGVPALMPRLPAGVLTERVPPGGVLVSLHGDAFDPADPAQIAEAKSIQNSLVREGLLRRKAKAEVPPDSQVIGRGLSAG